MNEEIIYELISKNNHSEFTIELNFRVNNGWTREGHIKIKTNPKLREDIEKKVNKLCLKKDWTKEDWKFINKYYNANGEPCDALKDNMDLLMENLEIRL